ncbi:MAG: hypothetical protein FWC34_00760 [Bacteroidetes bacterium]|nr:hypothetical protein [Bacteroidota bacterium]
MKQIYVILFLTSIILFGCGSSTENVPAELNVYGGKTIVLINDGENETSHWSKIAKYFNDLSVLVKTIFIPLPFVTSETGLTKQIEHHNENFIERYEMFFSDEFRARHDFNRVIEEIDINGLLFRTTWFIDDVIIDRIDYPRDMRRFAFYNIDYIGNVFRTAYELDPDPTRAVFGMSARYVSIRSVVRFDTELAELDEIDISIIRRLLTRFNAVEHLSIYTKKVRVFSGDNYYWLFVQDGLAEHIRGQYATISYYPISLNGKLFLICVGFFNINFNIGS